MRGVSIYNSRNLIGVFGLQFSKKTTMIYNSRNLIGVFGERFVRRFV